MYQVFILNSILLGVGLAMDAFSVSCANGLREPGMNTGRMSSIAGVYAFFQFAMPMIGWFCVHTIAETFTAFQRFIPWIALALLLWIGGKMLVEGIQKKMKPSGQNIMETDSICPAGGTEQDGARLCPGDVHETASSERSAASAAGMLTWYTLLVQGVATSIDALSVGFTIAEYNAVMALTACLIIAAVTFVICMGGLMIGRKVGNYLAGWADILGGCILIGIGVEIFVSAM